MIVLLDTCEFLWLISGDARLPKPVAVDICARAEFADRRNPDPSSRRAAADHLSLQR